MTRRACLLVALALIAAASPAHAAASWQGSGSGAVYSKAKAMPAGNTPTVGVSGRSVTVSWTASSLSGGGSLDGYVLRRYDGAGLEQTIGSDCSGTIVALTCTEQAVPAGSWRYTVTPALQSWRGAESAQSATATVASPQLTLSASTVTSLPTTLSGQITGFVAAQTVGFRLDDASSGQVLSGSITPNPVPTNGTASVSVTIPAGVANGAHTVYAVGSQGDTARTAVTVNVSAPVTISTSSWSLRDASSGTETDASDPTAFASDGLTYKTGTFNNAFAGNRYVQWEYNAPLRSGLATSSVSFDFRFRSSGGTEVACFYFEVIGAGTTIGTHGATTPGTASSTWCTDTTEKLVSTPLPEVTTSDVANGLRIKLYGYESAKKPLLIDQATVSGTASSQSFTLYETTTVDSATATAVTTPWALASAGDGAGYASAANWTTAFSSTRYLKLGFPAYVPATATVSSVSFKHSYRPINNSACYYFEVYAGATLLGSHGSAASPVSCNSSTSTYVTDAISLPEVTSAAQADNLTIKLYVDNSGAKKTEHDLSQLSVTYVP
jgi:hypothetical protein